MLLLYINTYNCIMVQRINQISACQETKRRKLQRARKIWIAMKEETRN
ncbi:hypothetical protein EKH55_4557 [Sinorhizobium alkalisoli]|nr:hypothetical protein EKH55_4557 [Sinorhizobium alkalisoli]